MSSRHAAYVSTVLN